MEAQLLANAAATEVKSEDSGEAGEVVNKYISRKETLGNTCYHANQLQLIETASKLQADFWLLVAGQCTRQTLQECCVC